MPNQRGILPGGLTVDSKNAFISLRCLYEFIRKRKDEHLHALNLETPLGGKYSALCDTLTAAIPELQGIYIWGAFDSKKYWKSLYLGKAGLGRSKKLLRARIREELKDERCSLWRYVLSKGQLLEVGPRVHHPGQWDRYIKNAWLRSLRKGGATHIVWAPARGLDNRQVRNLEAELIEAFNPEANRQRPIPPNEVLVEASRIFMHLRHTIHYIRSLSDDNRPFKLLTVGSQG